MPYPISLRSLLIGLLLVPQVEAASVSPERASGIYRGGEPVVFVVRPDQGQAADELERLTVVVLANSGGEPLATETKREADGSLRVAFTPKEAGWYVCKGGPGEELNKPKSTAVAMAGVMVDGDKLAPAAAEPEDFDAFWAGKRAELKAHPAEAVLKPLSASQLAVENRDGSALEQAGYERFDLEIASLPGLRPVRGYLARPKNAAPKSCPIIFTLHAAGIGAVWARGDSVKCMQLARDYHAIVVDLEAHGLMNGGTPEYYKEQGDAVKADNAARAGDRDTWFLAGMAVRLMRAIDYAASLPEWNGRHLVAMGESQGGGQALYAGALDPRVSGVVALVPAMCDFAGPLAGRPSGFPKPYDPKMAGAAERLRVVSYCDNVHLASRSRAETLIFAGLVDVTCPAPGITAVYNRLAGKKRLYLYPHKPHQGFPPGDESVGKFEVLRDAFLKEHFASAPGS